MNRVRERDIHRNVIEYLSRQYRKAYEMSFHPSNESTRGKRGWLDMANAPGVPDLIVLFPTRYYHGLAIEFKGPRTPMTPNQIDWILRLQVMGYKAAFIWTFEEGKRIIDEYMGEI